ncbi:GIDE domain-containing protein [Malonomonas rubra]|uniref:GIDE domain-containing protein n=1 Tax=Malonomonas rubra TaxID=57040 RepID=UPI0026ED7FD0|nr:GIDE domain-containing protein [Malonomonas rubra]
MSQPSYLIVEQQQQPAANLSDLLKKLSQQHQLDIYQSRQRLVGRGLSLLSKGPREKLEKISRLLQENGFTQWLLEPSKPEFIPPRIRALQIDNEKVTFSCQTKTVIFPKGATILAVFADMSGALAEKSVKQLLSSHAYRGRDNVRHLEDHKIHKTILQGKPLLDLYLLDKQKRVVNAVRIFPGKFDPKGLGERSTVSSVQNLDQILKLAEEYAGDFHLVTDFGLVNLPGCTLRRENLDNPETQRQNQISLAHYGWLLADLQRVGQVNPVSEESNGGDLTGAVATALLQKKPNLLATGAAEEVLPIAKEISREIDQASQEKQATRIDPVIAAAGLPAPPLSRRTCNWNKPSFWLGSAGAVIVGGIFTLLEIDSSGTLRKFVHHTFSSGAALFLFSALLVWSGFHFVRLKRQIENTPTSKVRSVAMGMVEIRGRAIRKYALISPMSHVPCVFYRLTKYRREKNNQWRVSSSSSSDSVPFLLEDDTGKVEVDPFGCRVSAGTKQEGTPGQVGLSHFSSDSDEKWVEEIIVEGTLLYVLGFAAVKKDTGPTLAEKKVEALRELKRNPQDIQQFDTDGDGKISSEEWDAARAVVADKVMRDELQKKQRRKKQEEHICIGKKKGRPLVIAETHSEEQLTRRYAFFSLAMFAFATGALGWGIRNLLIYFS